QLLRHAYRAIPYWHELIEKEFADGTVFDIKQFERLPILTRETLRERRHEFLIKNLERYKYRTFVTSGSTGIPKEFVAQKIYFQKVMATEEFYVNFCGLKAYKQYGFLLHKPHLEDLVTYISKDLDISTLQKLLRDKNVSAVGGSLHRLMSLAEKIENGEIRFRPKFVLSGAEFLTAENRRYLERIFQCPVYDKYVCAEAGTLGLECSERGGFHINPVNCYMEIVDDNGRPVTNGNLGKIVITIFNNRLMPLIRYDLGDTGSWINDKKDCGCGLRTPRLQFNGRAHDYLRFADGRKYSVLAFSAVDNKFASAIIKRQLIQESLTKLIFKFVPHKSYQPYLDGLKGEIRNYIINNRLRDFPSINVEVEAVPFLDNLKNGKYVLFESRIKDGLPEKILQTKP
ncbi:MAG: hypothetical protein Q7K44_02685, partial [Candidatus Liptonbacteria bacterium]|nr:hypothetical protein [Candidatus Liptonbacteria bacterium]